MTVSVVIPVRDDSQALAGLLAELQPVRGPEFEVIVVEAAPEPQHDEAALEAALVDVWLYSEPGRALQLQQGAQAAHHACLWFLHADTRDIAGAATWLKARCARGEPGAGWGRFDVRLDDERPILRVVSWFMNWRSRLTSICTGDQGMFVDRALFNQLGGWPQQPLMEDVELSKRLRAAAPAALPARGLVHITTSARRWQKQGAWRTIGLMWWLRLRYSLGGDPEKLYRLYYGAG